MRYLKMISLTAGACVLISACKQRHAADSQAAQNDEVGHSLGDFEALADGQLPLICGYLLSADDKQCHTPIIEAICEQGKPTLVESIAALQKHRIPEKIIASEAGRSDELTRALTDDFLASVRDLAPNEVKNRFEAAVDRCMNKEKYDEAEAFAAEAAKPEFQARAMRARQRFWTEMALGAVYPVIEQGSQQVLSYVLARKFSPKTSMRLRTYFWLSVGAAATDTLADFIETNELDPNMPDCAASSFVNRRMLRSCLKTSSSLMMAATGAVDVRNFGLVTDNEAVNLFEDVINVGLWSLCNAGGPSVRWSCGLINASAQQIGLSLRTGRNDWSECLPTAQAGRCLGKLYGSGGWTNTAGIEMPRQVKGEDGYGWWVRGCCRCTKMYEQRRSGYSAAVASESILSVIQSGDFESGSCAAMENKVSRKGGVVDNVLVPKIPVRKESRRYDQTRIANCMRVVVIGTSCSLREPTGATRTLPLWSEGRMSPLSLSVSSEIRAAH